MTQCRMRIMRQMRNYLSHTPDPGFLEVSDKQIEMLKTMVANEQMRGDVVKNHLLSPRRCSVEENALVKDALAAVARQNLLCLPVLREKKAVGIANIHKLALLCVKGKADAATKAAYGTLGRNMVFVRPEEKMENVCGFKCAVCCTEDGTPMGGFLGLCVINDKN